MLKHIIPILLILSLLSVNIVSAQTGVDADFTYESGNQVFSDVDENHWAFDYLSSVDNIGFFQSGAIDDSTGTFRCDEPANRAEASKLVAILFGDLDTDEILISTNADFSDIQENDWFYSYIEYLSSKGVIQGYHDNTFRPEVFITRAEMAKIAAGFLYNLETSGQVSIDIPEGTQSFTDVAITDWFYPYIEFLAKEDEDFDFYSPLTGYADNSFHPNANVTRCEMVKMVAEAYEYTQFISALANLDWDDLLQ